MSSFSKRLRQLRQERDITQDFLAKAVGISKSSINMYERGEREPGFETLEAIADFFNVNFDYLLGRTDDRGFSLSPAISTLKSIDRFASIFHATPDGDDIASLLLHCSVLLLNIEMSDKLSASEREQAHNFAASLLSLLDKNTDFIKQCKYKQIKGAYSDSESI